MISTNSGIKRLAVSTVVLLLTCVVTPALTQAQNRKEIHERLSLVTYPTALTFQLDGQPLKATEEVLPQLSLRVLKFQADAGWLNKLAIELKNVSGKSITYAVINLTFPQTANEKGRVGLHQIFLGIDPDRKFTRSELRLAPNDTIEIPLANELAQIKTFVETRLPLTDVYEVEIEMHAVLFDDGKLFEAGVMYQRDPNNYSKWIPIAKSR